jgi:hypothetical protein
MSDLLGHEANRDDWLDAKKAARYLGLGQNAVYRLAARGDIAVEGWPIRVRQSELAAFITRSRVKPGDLGRTLNPVRNGLQG